MATIYTAIETLLASVLPSDCKVFQANMPLQMMDSLARETMKLCTYLLYTDKIRVNSSGASTVHEVLIEFSFYGSLDDVTSMSNALQSAVIGNETTASSWRFILLPSQQMGKRDIWEPRIAAKREYLQLRGFAIEPEEE